MTSPSSLEATAVRRTVPIRRFIIEKLFAEKTIDLSLNSAHTVLIADNGSGKTTVLGIIYAVLARQLHRLRRVEFATIRVEFEHGPPLAITRDAIAPDLQLERLEPRIRRLAHRMPEGYFFHLADATRGLTLSEFRTHPVALEFCEMAGVPAAYLYDVLRMNIADQRTLGGEFATFEELRGELAKHFPHTLLYYPTYRRIEEELENLGYERKKEIPPEALIQFGMNDVKVRMKAITDSIKSSSVEWYSRINGQMLAQLVEGFSVTDVTRKKIQNVDALKIVLDRIGKNISPDHKLRIMNLVDSGEIAKPQFETLTYFLSNLLLIFDQQRQLDNSIKDFTRICNKYLVDKEIIYNESLVEIYIVQKWNGKRIDAANLSSGEKQIVSLFSRLYLDKSQDTLAVLFDEPELSLSMTWQRMLLPDVIASSRCAFLLATTHSPFIFENELDEHAFDLEKFIERATE